MACTSDFQSPSSLRQYSEDPLMADSISDSIFYFVVASSVAELASSMPSSGTGSSLALTAQPANLHSLRSSISLGDYHWRPLRAGMWLVCRLVELPRLAGRRCLASVLHGTPDSGGVHDSTSRYCRGKLAHLHQLPYLHLAVLPYSSLREQIFATH